MRRRHFLRAFIAISLVGCTSSPTDTPRVASIEVSPESAVIGAGNDAPLTARVLDQGGNVVVGPDVRWSSSDTSVATVSVIGVVRARAPGKASIAASAAGVSAIASVTVSPRTVASVVLDPPSVQLRVGATTTVHGRTLDAEGSELAGRPLTWSSSNPLVATVNAQGVVTAVAPGAATISAVSEGRTGTAGVSVAAIPVASVSISPPTNNLRIGETTQLTAVPRDASNAALTNRVIVWSTSDATVASVSSTGLVTGVALGTATITATSEGKSGTAQVAVQPRPVNGVLVLPSDPSVAVGANLQLGAQLSDLLGNILLGRTVTWSSSNNAIATVNAAGLVTAVSTGNVTITATSEGKTGSTIVHVVPIAVASVDVSPPTPSILTGTTVLLTATPRSAAGVALSGRAVTWSSGAVEIATVSNNGLVTGVAPGSIAIFATVEGVTSSATVTVRAPAVASVTISPSAPSINLNANTQLTATLRDASGAVLSGRQVTWSSSDENTVFVTSSGVIFGFKTGTATITATSEGVSGSVLVTVH